MPVSAIVVNFDVFKHDAAHLLAVNDGFAMHFFHLQGVEEAFQHGHCRNSCHWQIVVRIGCGLEFLSALAPRPCR